MAGGADDGNNLVGRRAACEEFLDDEPTEVAGGSGEGYAMTEAPTRKDVVRNRGRLLDAARQLMREDRLEVSLKDVARHAGVGVGTVYRHFPTKDSLVAALFADQLDVEVQRARDAAAQGDAWCALVEYLEGAMRLQAENRGLRALMCPAGSVFASVQECKAVVNPYLVQVIELAQAQGTLRLDCTLRDILLLQVALVGIMDATPEDPNAYQRHLELFLHGIRNPEPPPTTGEQSHD